MENKQKIQESLKDYRSGWIFYNILSTVIFIFKNIDIINNPDKSVTIKADKLMITFKELK